MVWENYMANGECMRREIVLWGLLACLPALAWGADEVVATPKVTASGDRLFWPHNAIRGFVDFQVAPPHNEPDMGLCVVTKDNPLYTVHPDCSAYARYILSGYLEMQPVGRGPLRRAFIFIEPKLFGGDNLPQQSYSAAASPILWESIAGIGYDLPKGFELRATHHQVNLLGRYSGANGNSNLRTDGPYGQYTTAGVRWYFGGYGRSLRAP
jgi:hypothetical protein